MNGYFFVTAFIFCYTGDPCFEVNGWEPIWFSFFDASVDLTPFERRNNRHGIVVTTRVSSEAGYAEMLLVLITMTKHPVIVLPGLDGTTGMLSSFRDSAPADCEVSLVDLPPDLSTYDSLAKSLADSLTSLFSDSHPCTLVAESFSGPLAVMLAAQFPQSITRLVLAASFVSPPVPRLAKFVPWSLLFRIPMPAFAAHQWMLGRGAVGRGGDRTLVRQLQQTVRSVPSRLLAERVQEVIRVDVRTLLQELSCPVMYLRPLQDRLIPERCVREIRTSRPDAVLAELDGPHLVLETRPQEAWEKIREFVGRV